MCRGLKNNNPGNIRRTNDKWRGLKPKQTDKEFFQFQHIVYGYRALIKLLQNYNRLHGCETIREIITRWAPPNENNTEGYIKAVCKSLKGISPDVPFNLYSKWSVCCLASAISEVENGVQADMLDVVNGWNLLQREVK